MRYYRPQLYRSAWWAEYAVLFVGITHLHLVEHLAHGVIEAPSLGAAGYVPVLVSLCRPMPLHNDGSLTIFAAL